MWHKVESPVFEEMYFQNSHSHKVHTTQFAGLTHGTGLYQTLNLTHLQCFQGISCWSWKNKRISLLTGWIIKLKHIGTSILSSTSET